MLKEFQKFIMRGNVLDLAVGVIIGGAFGKIVTSIVNDMIMPIIGLIVGSVNFENMFLMMGSKEGVDTHAITTLAEAKAADIPTLNYGAFLTNIIDFLIIAFIVFLIVKGINKLSEAKNILPFEQLNNLNPLNKKKKKAKSAEPAPVPTPPAPTTKECPFCMSTINIKASRCPNCTSELENIENT